MQTRQQKETIVADLRNTFAQAKGVVFLSLRKLSTPNLLKLKQAVRADGGLFTVVKKTLLTIAHPDVAKQSITGPFAVVIDRVGDLKPFAVLGKHQKELELEVYGGEFEAQTLSVQEVWTMATLPPREVLLAKLVGALQSPLRRVTTAVQSPIQQLVAVLDQIKSKKSVA